MQNILDLDFFLTSRSRWILSLNSFIALDRLSLEFELMVSFWTEPDENILKERIRQWKGATWENSASFCTHLAGTWRRSCHQAMSDSIWKKDAIWRSFSNPHSSITTSRGISGSSQRLHGQTNKQMDHNMVCLPTNFRSAFFILFSFSFPFERFAKSLFMLFSSFPYNCSFVHFA